MNDELTKTIEETNLLEERENKLQEQQNKLKEEEEQIRERMRRYVEPIAIKVSVDITRRSIEILKDALIDNMVGEISKVKEEMLDQIHKHQGVKDWCPHCGARGQHAESNKK